MNDVIMMLNNGEHCYRKETRMKVMGCGNLKSQTYTHPNGFNLANHFT